MTPPFRLAVRGPGQMLLHVLVDDRLPVGRAGNGLIIADERMSRRHCEFRVHERSLLVRDCGSSNGTTVNGATLDEERRLHVGDVVAAGETHIEVIDPDGSRDAVGSTVMGTIVGDPTATDPPPSVGAPTARTEQVPTTPSEADDGGAGAHDDEASLRASIVGGTLTMVLTDIVGSTDLVHHLADQRWLEVLGRHDTITRTLVARFQGTEVKGQGDGFLLTFPSARHALLFSISLQRALAEERDRDPSFPIHLRTGVHTGEVLHADGDVFGRHVHRAARVAALAQAEQILTSSLVRELAEPMGDISFGNAHEVELKGFPGTTTVSEVQWQTSAP